MEWNTAVCGSVGYLDILLTGNRVVDAKDWTGWAKHSTREQDQMLLKLTEQARKYLSNREYTPKFEFKESIPESVLRTRNQLGSEHGGRLSWEAIP